jgi:hypothetical protein
VWRGEYRGRVWSWLRLWDSEGNLVLTQAEHRAIAEAQVQQERERAAQLQAELERLREQLRQHGAEAE